MKHKCIKFVFNKVVCVNSTSANVSTKEVSIGLVRTGNAATWSQNFMSQSSTTCETIYLTGLAILGVPGHYATGLAFHYSDGSSFKVGIDYGNATSVLNFSNPNGLSSVNSYGGTVIDVLQICNGGSGNCVTAGNTAGKKLNHFTNISSMWFITSFWGKFYNYGGYRCLENFGIDYYVASYSTSKCFYIFHWACFLNKK